MIRTWLNRLSDGFARISASANADRRQTESSTPTAVEPLEGRTLLAAVGPHVASFVADNRGQAVLTFDQSLNASTVTSRTALIYTAGRDGKFGTRDDVAQRTAVSYGRGALTLTAPLRANTAYRVPLLRGGINVTHGLALAGNYSRRSARRNS